MLSWYAAGSGRGPGGMLGQDVPDGRTGRRSRFLTPLLQPVTRRLGLLGVDAAAATARAAISRTPSPPRPSPSGGRVRRSPWLGPAVGLRSGRMPHWLVGECGSQHGMVVRCWPGPRTHGRRLRPASEPPCAEQPRQYCGRALAYGPHGVVQVHDYQVSQGRTD